MTVSLLYIKEFGSKVESEVAGLFVFSHIQKMDYFRIGYIINGLKTGPQGYSSL